jgi:hypothetical protein
VNHFICESCETVHHCAANGCIPISEYDDFTSESAQKDFLTFRDFLLAIVSMAFAFVSGVVVGVGGGVIARWMA